MLKIFGIKPCKNNKSCGISLPDPNKISLVFFLFFYNFLRILQLSAKALILFKNHFAVRPLKFSAVHNYTLTFAL
jgi:hypothetical protein